ncbi:hypothetical protein ACFSQP_07415 [Bizionia sediminis]|uniref:DUF4142 domain-containing protein n=1 Tax=Bizionia sediminis TaxID=1737064 RepID=A0ABW5KS49_9FLAO
MKISYFLLVLCMVSCTDLPTEKTTEPTEVATPDLVSKADIAALKYVGFTADNKVQQAIANWTKYKELQSIITDVKMGNLSFFKSNQEILATLNAEVKSTIPATINSPFVMARLIALETKMFKLESEMNLANPSKARILASVKELLEAFSNLNLQMNKQIEKESQRIQKPS